MTKNNKIRATYENLFQKLVSTGKTSHKIDNFIRSVRKSVHDASMLPIKFAEAQVSLYAPPPSKGAPKRKAVKSPPEHKESPRKRARKK